MPITIQPYAEEHIEAVRQFNDRLNAGGLKVRFPLSPVSDWLPKTAGRTLFQERFVALDDSAAVHGAYVLKHQDFWIAGKSTCIADFALPISEGLISRKYPQIGVQLLRHALQKQPLLFALGMGGQDEAVVRLLQAAGWKSFTIPFFFHVVHPAAFLRNITHLRRGSASRWALDILAATGLGWLGVRSVQFCSGRRLPHNSAVAVETTDEFADWADELWRQCANQYGMAAVRDAATLRILYPREKDRFIRLKVTEHSRPIGWAVLLDTQCSGHSHFGDMRLGSVVDCMSGVGDAAKVVAAARQYLESRGVDLIVSNQSHAAWCGAFRRTGFLQGPSNFVFAASPKLVGLLEQNNVGWAAAHINRGDGDGPINL
jgi:hypothetical protein